MESYPIDEAHPYNLGEHYQYLVQHKQTLISKINNTIFITYNKEVNNPSAGFRIKLATHDGKSYILKLSAELIKGDKAFIYCESDANSRLIPRIYYLYANTQKQSYILHFVARSAITYVGILFHEKYLDYTLALYDFIIEQNDCPEYVGPIFDHLLPDKSEILNILNQPANPFMRVENHKRNDETNNDRYNNNNDRYNNSTARNNINNSELLQKQDGYNNISESVIWKSDMPLYHKYSYLVNQFRQYLLTHNLNHIDTSSNYNLEYSQPRLVVTIGTELDDPEKLKQVIISLQNQVIQPDAIYINIPYNFSKNAKVIPEWLLELHKMSVTRNQIFGNNNLGNNISIIINRCPNYGALTGLYGYLPINDGALTKVCLITDTKICSRTYLSDLIEESKKYPNAIIVMDNPKINNEYNNTNRINNQANGYQLDFNIVSLSGGILLPKNICHDDIKELIRILEVNDLNKTAQAEPIKNPYNVLNNVLELLLSIYINAKGLMIRPIGNTYNLENDKICDLIKTYFEKAKIIVNISNLLNVPSVVEHSILQNKNSNISAIIQESEPLHHIFSNETIIIDETDPLITSKKVAVIVEPRKDSILIDVVEHYRNILDESWLIQIFHGYDNKKMIIDSRLKEWIKKDQIILTQLNVHNLSRLSYSRMLLTKEFYSKINADHILIFQTDTCLCHKRSEYTFEDFLQYDYVGAPWDKKIGPKSLIDPKRRLYIGNGGISLRKKQTMLDICKLLSLEKYKHLYRHNEDQIISSFLLEKTLFPDAKIAPYDMAKKFAVECVYSPGALAIHKPWKHLSTKDLAKLKIECPDMVRLFKNKYFR